MGPSRTDVLLMVGFCSKSLEWDIYDSSKKRALFFFSLELTWNPIVLCLLLLCRFWGLFL